MSAQVVAMDEWAVLRVLAGQGRAELVDPTAPPTPTPPTLSAHGVLGRDIGQVVGRRREQRRWPVELLGPNAVGLVIYGIGGIGKPRARILSLARACLADRPGTSAWPPAPGASCRSTSPALWRGRLSGVDDIRHRRLPQGRGQCEAMS